MGILLTTLLHQVSRIVSSEKSWSIIVVGPNNAGKTTLLETLKDDHIDGEEIKTIPTVGHTVETIQYKSLVFHMWDLGGQDKIRILWKNYYLTADAVIFMVDSSDPDSFPTAELELKKMFSSQDLKLSAPILILENKQDLRRKMKSSSQKNVKLQVPECSNRKIQVFPCVVSQREGIEEALTWLVEALTNK